MSELEKAIGLWRAGKFVEARTICGALLADDSRNVAALNLLAEVHKATGNGPGILDCLTRVSALCPQDASTGTARASLRSRSFCRAFDAARPGGASGAPRGCSHLFFTVA